MFLIKYKFNFNLDKKNIENMQFTNGCISNQQEQTVFYEESNLMTPPNYYQYIQKQAQNFFNLKPDINTNSLSMSNLNNYKTSNVLSQRVPRRRWNVTSQDENLTKMNFQQQQKINTLPSNLDVDESEPKFIENTGNNFLHQNFAQQRQYQYLEPNNAIPSISSSVSLNGLRLVTLDENNLNIKQLSQKADNQNNSTIYYPASHFLKNTTSDANVILTNSNENFSRKSSTRNSFSKQYLKNIEV